MFSIEGSNLVFRHIKVSFTLVLTT